MSGMGTIWRQLLGITISAISIFWANGTLAQSKIIPDNTLGAEKSNVIPNFNGLPVEVINGGATRGQNLFHSFLEFNVSEGRGAYFLSPSAGIQNIVTRVTGSNRSEILGVLGTFGYSNPNLFLINPNGIIFGPNARLDVGGSFAATTANAIQFGNLGIFSATTPDAPSPLLTINPSALLYNQIAAGASIQNSSTTGLHVPDGKSLLLIGGNVNLDGGQIRANGGRVELAGLAAPGTVGLNVAGNTLSLSVPSNIQRSDVSLSNQANVFVTGAGGGDIAINAHNFNMTGSGLVGGIVSSAGTVNSKSGNIDINATDTVTIDGSSSMSSSTTIVNAVTATGNGNAGNIFINTNSLNIIGNAQVGSFTDGQGNAGNVTIQATDAVSFSGINSGVLSSVASSGVGNGGDISIQARLLSLSEGAQIGTTTFGRGNAGNIKINVADSISVNKGAKLNTSTYGQGNAGNIQITTDQLSLTNGAQLEASTYGQGNAGNVIIDASKSVFVDGNQTHISSTVGEANSSQNNLVKGNSGNIQIATERFSLSNGALLSASTFGQGNAGNVIINTTKSVSLDGSGSTIFSDVGAINNSQNNFAKGNGGNVQITTDQLSLSNGAQLAVGIFGQGNAGNVIINATKNVSLDSSSILSTVGYFNYNQNNLTIGNGGNIQITTDQLSLSNGAELVANTFGQGNAGNVIINAAKTVSLGSRSHIFSEVGAINNSQNNFAKGNGGNVQITTDQLSLSNGAQLSASTLGQGDAGNVMINASKSVFLDGDQTAIFSTMEAINNSQNNLAVGKGGNIQITTDQLSLSNGAQLLANTYGQGNAGNVIINVTKSVSLGSTSGIFSDVGGVGVSINNDFAKGNGGNIQINTDQLSLTKGAQLSASTFGQGNAGNVIINTTKSVSLDGSNSAIFSNVGDVKSNQNNIAKGKGGNVQITTDQFSLTNGSQLVTTTLGQGNAGNVIINATKSVSLDGSGSAIFSSVGAPNNPQNNLVKGNSGNIQITTDRLSLTNGAQLVASTLGQGDAGNVIINATKSVSLDSSSILSTIGHRNYNQNNLVKGNSGNIQITTDQLSLTNGTELVVNTFGQGNAGNVIINAIKSVSLDNSVIFSDVGAINNSQNNFAIGNSGNIQITTPQFSLSNGAQLTTSTLGQGNAGNVIINATKRVSVDGYINSNGVPIYSSIVSAAGASNYTRNDTIKGNGGSIQINTDELSLSNGARLNAGTYSQSNAGNLEIAARSIRLDNGFIASQTKSGNGGNITLTPNDLLLLRHDSQISTTAGIAQLGGNGGNITINAPLGFIVAIPNEKSNITANAFSGTGGKIQINATSVFGLTVLSREDLIKLLGNNNLAQLDLQQLPTSAITAVSQTNPTLNGTVVLNTANINPSKELVQLSTNLINPNTLLANSCIARTQKQQGTFYITGAGGLPNRPGDASISSYPTGTVRNVGDNSTSSSWHKGDPIVEPQGVYRLPNGHLVLSRECS